MADENFTIGFTAESDDLVQGTRKVVSQLDSIGEAAKRATSAGDGLIKKFSHLSNRDQIAALDDYRKRLEKLHASYVKSDDPRRREKFGAVGRVLSSVESRIAMLSASSGSGQGTGFTMPTHFGAASGFRSALMSGGGLSDALAGGLIGGMIGGIISRVMSSVFGAIRSIGAMPGEARELTPSAKAEEAAIKKTFEWSEGARENMAMIANIWTAFSEGFKKVFGEGLGNMIGSFRVLMGVIEQGIGHIMQNIPWMGAAGKSLVSRGEAMTVQGMQTLPTWAGGTGGTGESGVVTGEQALGKIEGKKEEEKKEKAKQARLSRERAYETDLANRRERWDAQQFTDLIKTLAEGTGGARGSSNGMYAVGGEAAARAYFDEANNLQREAIGELRKIEKNTQMPMTREDYEMNGFSLT